MRFHVLRVTRQHLLIIFSSLIKRSSAVVQARQGELYVRVLGQDFNQTLVSLDCLRIVVVGLSMYGCNQVFFRCRQVFAQVQGFSGRLLGLVCLAEIGIALAKLGVSQGKVRILFNGGLETLRRLLVLALPSQFQSLRIMTQRLNGLR